LVDRLAALALRLHALAPDDWPGPADPSALVAKRLGLPRRVAEEVGDRGLAAALARVDALGPEELVGGPAVVCHGDFHPLNVMVDGRRSWVLDWSDAGLGPPESDVARTLLLLRVVASIAASGRLERTAIRWAGPPLARRYARTYVAGRALDEGRLRRWTGLHALHGWSQVVMLHADGFAGASSADGRQDEVPLELASVLRAEVEASIG
jgi:aminoglycoside phosphotransferase (APT) family kinase protein